MIYRVVLKNSVVNPTNSRLITPDETEIISYGRRFNFKMKYNNSYEYGFSKNFVYLYINIKAKKYNYNGYLPLKEELEKIRYFIVSELREEKLEKLLN